MKQIFYTVIFCNLLTNLEAQIDNTFNSGGSGANSTINCVALQSDGKIIIGGSFVQYNTSGKNGIARLNTNGTIDNTFAIGSGAIGTIYSLAVQPDGKILVGGLFSQFNGVAKNNIVRLTSTGTIDNTFNIGSGASGAVRAVAIQADGKILFGGSFAQYNGIAQGKIVRVNSIGAIDNAFNSGGAGFNASGAVYSLAIQTDGKIIVGGSFVQYNATAKNRLVRLTTSGAIDAGFNSGGSSASGDVNALKLQPDGKILAGGTFTQYNTSAEGRIVRLSTTGTIDAGFNSGGSGASADVNTIALQSNGKIILGGIFTQFNTTAHNRIIRLTTSGTIDNTLSVGSGASSGINGIAIQSNGGLIVVGTFVQFNTFAVGRIVRILPSGTLPLRLTSFTSLLHGNVVILQWSTAQEQNTSHFDIERSFDGQNFIKTGNSLNAKGSSEISSEYKFVDNLPGINVSRVYYRLKMIDNDGRFTYSPVRSVNNTNQSLTIYPNPVTNKTLKLNSANTLAGKYTFELFTVEGKLLFSKELLLSTGSSSQVVHLPAAIASGSYIVKVRSANETKVLQQLVFVE